MSKKETGTKNINFVMIVKTLKDFIFEIYKIKTNINVFAFNQN